MFWNPVSKAKYWYTSMPEGDGDTILRIKHFLMVNIKLVEISNNNKLPKGCNKKRVNDKDIDELIETIRRRVQFDEQLDIKIYKH